MESRKVINARQLAILVWKPYVLIKKIVVDYFELKMEMFQVKLSA